MARSVAVHDPASRSFFFFQAEDGIRYYKVTGVQTCALPISFGIVVSPAEYTIVLKPVQDHTLPRIRPNNRVAGWAIQFTSREEIPIEPKKEGTNPIGASIVKPSSTPITMSGVTMPRKMNDFTMVAPRTRCRSTASARPVNSDSGKWITIQRRLLTRVPYGGSRGSPPTFTVAGSPRISA